MSVLAEGGIHECREINRLIVRLTFLAEGFNAEDYAAELEELVVRSKTTSTTPARLIITLISFSTALRYIML